MNTQQIQKKAYDALKSIFDSGIGSREQRSEIHEALEAMEQTAIPTEGEYELIKLQENYIVDRDDPEDEKWEGAKELKLAEEVGKAVLRKGCFEKSVAKLGNGKEQCIYNLLVLKRK